MPKILILQGPNLNLLGTREPEIYGKTTLAELHAELKAASKVPLAFFQSNAEHELIDRIQGASRDGIELIIFNPAGYSHTSIALRDAILAAGIPMILVHISDPSTREPFRHTCFFSDIALTSIVGKGIAGYHLALQCAEQFVENRLMEQAIV